MTENKLTIAICAGEASGDKLAAQLVLELQQYYPQAQFYGIGGTRMAAAGVDLLADYQTLAVMGYWDVLTSLPAIFRLRQRFIRYTKIHKPDIFIGVDAPDFNLPLARRLRQNGSCCLQYVAPSVWMWRRQRLANIAQAVDAVLCLLPFEKSHFTAAGIAAYFVGHPAAQQQQVERNSARQRLGIAEDMEVIALLPGSRRSELARHLPLLQKVVPQLLNAKQNRCCVTALANDTARQQVQQLLPQVKTATVEDVLAAADIALVKSGTMVLETALAGVPLLVFYRLSAIATWLVRWRKFHLPFFSLPNILSKRFVTAELLLNEATADNIVRESERLLNDNSRRYAQQQEFTRIRNTLAAAEISAAAAVVAVAEHHKNATNSEN